jgi:hypothetical protein
MKPELKKKLFFLMLQGPALILSLPNMHDIKTGLTYGVALITLALKNPGGKNMQYKNWKGVIRKARRVWGS